MDALKLTKIFLDPEDERIMKCQNAEKKAENKQFCGSKILTIISNKYLLSNQWVVQYVIRSFSNSYLDII